jgi:hypothetical protein
MSRWWRAYDEAVDDPKLIALSDAAHRAWFNLLCLSSANAGAVPSDKILKIKLRLSSKKLEKVLAELRQAGLLDTAEDGREIPHNWGKRQYQSDTSTPRVKRFREKQRNVSETPPDNRVQSTEKKDAPSAPLLGQPTADAELYARGKQILGKSSGGLIAKLIKSKNGNLALARAAIEQASTKQNPSEYIARIVHGTAGSKVDLGDPQDVMRFILS